MAKRFSVTAVSKLTGLTPDTLRAWERRHGAVKPIREGRGRRFYTEEDVLRLDLLHQASRIGHPIRLTVGLQNDALRELIGHGAKEPSSIDVPGQLVGRMIEALENYADREFEILLGTAAASFPSVQFVSEVVFPLLREVGDRWHKGTLTVAQEHRVSASVRDLIGSLRLLYPRAREAPAVLFAGLSGELHELGILLSSMIAASRGTGCHYLGVNTPPEEIARAALASGCAVVALGIVIEPGQNDAAEQLRRLRNLLDREVEVWLGGAGAGNLSKLAGELRMSIVEDVYDFERRIEILTERPSA